MAGSMFGYKGLQNRAIPHAGMILVFLMLTAPMVSIFDGQDYESNELLKIEEVDSRRDWSQATAMSIDDYEHGGRHIVTDDWWEPKNPWIATSDDIDGDGWNNSFDDHPWDRQLPTYYSTSCAFGCVAAPTFSLSDNGVMPEFTESSITAYSSIDDAVLGDLDGDGDLDLVFLAGYYVEYSENVNGEYKIPTVWTYLHGALGSLDSVELVDADNDGFLDVLVSGYHGIAFVDLEGVFEPNFPMYAYWLVNSGGTDANYWGAVEYGDINGDYCPDILAYTMEDDYDSAYRLKLFLNSCITDTFDFNEVLNLSTGYLTSAILMDINGDGYDDVLHASNIGGGFYYNTIKMHISSGVGTVSPVKTEWSFASNSTIGHITDLASGDMNNDGYYDLIVSGTYESAVLFHDGSSGIDVFPTTFNDEYYSTNICTDPTDIGLCQIGIMTASPLVDINHDGLKDILYGGKILLNLGSNTGTKNLFGEYWDSGGAHWLRAGDVSGNGVNDILAITRGSPMAFFYNGGSIPGNVASVSLSSPGTDSSQKMSSDGLSGDIDHDGDIDIITTSNGDKMGIHINDGIGGFSEVPDIILDTPSQLSGIGVMDFNGDGVDEIIIVGNKQVVMYWGDQDLVYNESSNGDALILFETSCDAYFASIIIEDFNGDGFYDIAFDTNYHYCDASPTIRNETLNILLFDDLNNTFSKAWNSSRMSSTFSSDSIKYLDLDSDGDFELIRCLASSVEIYNSSNDLFVSEPWIIPEKGRNCMFMDGNFDGYLDLVSRDGSRIQLIAGPLYNFTFLDKYVYSAKSFNFIDIDLDGYLELIVGTSKNKMMRVYDINYTDITNLLWEGGNYKDTNDFEIADFNGDGTLDILQKNSQEPWDIIFSIQDTDYDATPDETDAYPLNPTQIEDSDGDGYGDYQSGFLPDDCPFYWGDSVSDRRGCPDQDGDGWSDLGDDFWREPTQWKDTDGDGFGDNHDGSSARSGHWPGEHISNAYNPDPSPLDFDNDGFEDEGLSPIGVDDCPKEVGWSYEDRFGCLDTDWDGWSNNDEDWEDGDDFPNDFTQHSDADGDGFGDDINGSQGDSCPQTAGMSFRDKFGCVDLDRDGWSTDSDFDDDDPSKWGVDSDGDGVSDENDHFPDDVNQSRDKDGDGYGDDSSKENGDDCPNEAGTSYLDKSGCVDKDEDGVSDNGDLCPGIPGWSNPPWAGCPDSDGDGTADVIDAFPDDSSEHIDTDGDGIGDNSDLCINKETKEANNCFMDKDNDGFNDSVDVFPEDGTQWKDADGDGYGDNPNGSNADAFPTDSKIWSDADGDGWADQFGHPLTDDCPSLPGSSSTFMNGCSDLDEDGMPDILDPDIDGDGITNDNEMDASTPTLIFDPFDPSSRPQDIDGDFIPDALDHDRDGDGFPDELERERGSDYKDGNKTPFNQYGDQDTGLFYVPGEGFKSQYDPEGVEISVSVVIDLITSELLVPLAMIPITVFALMRKRRRYKKMRNRLEDCNDVDMLKEYEEDIDELVVHRKVKVEHGMLLRNMFERMRDQFEDQEQVRLLGGKGGAGSGGMGRGGGRQNIGPQLPQRGGMQRQQGGGPSDGGGPKRPGGRGGGRY